MLQVVLLLGELFSVPYVTFQIAVYLWRLLMSRLQHEYDGRFCIQSSIRCGIAITGVLDRRIGVDDVLGQRADAIYAPYR